MKNLVDGRVNRYTYFVAHFLWLGMMICIIIGISVLFAIYRIIFSFSGHDDGVQIQPMEQSQSERIMLSYPPGMATPVPTRVPGSMYGFTSVGSAVNGIINILFFFALLFTLLIPLIGMISLQIRRFHDIGQSGWLVLLSLVPVIGSVVWFMLFFIPGESGKNKWGKQPPEGVASINYMLGLG